jgi:transposase-like protein
LPPLTGSPGFPTPSLKIYLSPSAESASAALEEFAGVWDTKYPMTAKSWRNRWNEVIPFFKFSPEIRKAV